MKVAIIKDENLNYCKNPPFNPQELYPEYPFGDKSTDNQCYAQVRQLFYKLGLDAQNYGTKSWNPLGDIIKPGQSVFIKPNMVRDYNLEGGTECMITHGSVIRAVLDYAYIALQGKGNITIGDSPYFDADFDKIVKITGIDEIIEYYKNNSGMPIALVDMRMYRESFGAFGRKRSKLIGDPLGYSIVDLGTDSDHFGVINNYKKFRGGYYYNSNDAAKHHNLEKNEYYIANSILNADVIINLPKLKTHGKSGMTCALKNLIGINGLKDWLPHHRRGSPESGGDEYLHGNFRKSLLLKLRDEQYGNNNSLYIVMLKALCEPIYVSRMISPFRDDVTGGEWHGNDTITRTISDLNKILFYCDKNGKMQSNMQRKEFCLVDGIVAGDHEGPLSPIPKKIGVLVSGVNPVAIDLVCSRVMGFDYMKMSMFKQVMQNKKYPILDVLPDDIEIISGKNLKFSEVYNELNCNFDPNKGWVGHIEYEKITT